MKKKLLSLFMAGAMVASLAACAQFRGVNFGQLLYTADSLADAQNYDERNWGSRSTETALLLCLDIASRLS